MTGHAELESFKAKAYFLDDVLKVNRMEVAAIKDVVAEQRARLDTTGARMVELKNCRDEANVLTATCCTQLLQVQKSLAAASEKVQLLQHALLQ